ncbi:hypothetical protein [Thermus oshimai]
MADGNALWGSGKGKSSQVRLVEAKVRASPVTWAFSLGWTGVRRKKAALEAFSFNPVAALRLLELYAV